MLELTNLTKKFNGKDILLNISVNFKKGNIILIIGKNGSGKSTLLDCIVRPKYADGGDIKIDGSLVDELSVRRKMFYIPSYLFLDESITAREYLNLVKDIYKQDYAQCIIEKFKNELEELNIYDSINNSINTFSLGMKKKLFFVASLVSGADFLIYDELFNGIDKESLEYIIDILEKIRREKCIIITTHNIDQLNRCYDILYMIEDGNLI